MPLRSGVLKTWPPGGWSYYEPSLQWHAPAPMQTTFERQVKNLMAVRRSNPVAHLPSDYLSCAKAISDYTCERLKNHPKWCLQVGDLTAKKAISLYPGTPKDEVEGVAEVKAAALLEWLGAGGVPVPKELAETRAIVCAGCPENSGSPACPPGNRLGWRDWVTAQLAKVLGTYLAIKNELKLSTSQDAVLDKCLACRCELKLKVWTPLTHIRQNASVDDLQKLDKRCWVLHE